MVACPNCGAELSDTAKFCRKCGTKIEHGSLVEAPDEPVFEEPVETEDGSVEFDWDQPVKVEESKVDKETNGKSEEDRIEPEAEENIDTKVEGEESYDWGPPTGVDVEDDTMMPVAFAGRQSAIEEVGEDGYEYAGDGFIPLWDHTHEFDPEDISDNKVMALAAYVLGPLGIIIALLAAQTSPYAGFHVRQGLKLTILEALTAIVMVLLCWTLVVPVAAAVFLVILMVIRVIAFVAVCKGRAIEPPMVRNIRFLK